MEVIVIVNGVSPDNSWNYQGFTYSCIEHNDKFKCIHSEGQWYTSTTPHSISTHFAFEFKCLFITPDTMGIFLELLKNKLNTEFANRMPAISDLKNIASKIKWCPSLSLKNLCFTYFANTYNNGGAEKLSRIPKEVMDDFEDFRQTFRINESW